MELTRTFGIATTIDGVPVIDQTSTVGAFKANPTLATGDWKVSIDGGSFANLGTLPSAAPASGRSLLITLTAAEMSGKHIVIQGVDAAGAEWCDQQIIINTQPPGIVRANACQAGGSSTTAVLDSSASATNSVYVGMPMRLYQTNGTGIIADVVITGYVGSTKTATFTPAAGFSPIATTIYEIGRGAANLAAVGNGLIDAQTPLSIFEMLLAVHRGKTVVTDNGPTRTFDFYKQDSSTVKLSVTSTEADGGGRPATGAIDGSTA